MARYGWFIKRVPDGDFLAFRPDTNEPYWTADREEAEHYSARRLALQAATNIDHPAVADASVELVEHSFHDAPIPDADTRPTPTLDEVLAPARARIVARKIAREAAAAVKHQRKLVKKSNSDGAA